MLLEGYEVCAMSMSAGSSSGVSSEINVTPLIDVLLVLLIIFIVIVPIAPRGLESSVPQGKVSEAKVLQPVVVRLLARNASADVGYEIGGKEVAYADLEPTLRSMFAARDDRTLFVEADRDLSYQPVAEVVGKARRAGAGLVSLGSTRLP
jgi:biopolymer transport protein ExbD